MCFFQQELQFKEHNLCKSHISFWQVFWCQLIHKLLTYNSCFEESFLLTVLVISDLWFGNPTLIALVDTPQTIWSADCLKLLLSTNFLVIMAFTDQLEKGILYLVEILVWTLTTRPSDVWKHCPQSSSHPWLSAWWSGGGRGGCRTPPTRARPRGSVCGFPWRGAPRRSPPWTGRTTPPTGRTGNRRRSNIGRQNSEIRPVQFQTCLVYIVSNTVNKIIYWRA